MTVYDPATWKTVVARDGEASWKFAAVNKFLMDANEAGLLDLVVSVDAPGDTNKLWLDISSPEYGNGVPKFYSGGIWAELTKEGFADHIGAAAGGGTWGSITGTLSSQTDLQTALDAKLAVSAASETIDDRVAALLTAGTNITLTYNDEAGTLTVDAAGGGGGGDVSAAANFGTDNVLIRSDGTAKGVQSTGITVADTTNAMSGVGDITFTSGTKFLRDSNGVPVVGLLSVASAADYLQISNATSGNRLLINGSGTGILEFESSTGLKFTSSGNSAIFDGNQFYPSGAGFYLGKSDYSKSWASVMTSTISMASGVSVYYDTASKIFIDPGTNAYSFDSNGTVGLPADCVLDFGAGAATLTHDDAAATLTLDGAGLVLPSGGTTMAPLRIQTGGSVLTSPVAGALEFEGGVFYATHADNARGVLLTEQFSIVESDRTLTSTTAQQAIFSSGHDALTVQGSTTYWFDAQLYLLSMSATSGNLAFSILGAGTATITSVQYHCWGLDAIPTTAAAHGGVLSATATSASNIVTAATGTGLVASIRGLVRINAAGTIIPSVGLTTAAAATMKANSWIRLRPIGSNTVSSVGNWG